MDPKLSPYWRPELLEKKKDKPVVSQNGKLRKKGNKPKSETPEETIPESGNESGNDGPIIKPEGLYWVNRHNISAVPILNWKDLRNSGKRAIIEIPDNDIEWQSGTVVRHLVHRVFVPRKDIMEWDKAIEAVNKLRQEMLEAIEQCQSTTPIG